MNMFGSANDMHNMNMKHSRYKTAFKGAATAAKGATAGLLAFTIILLTGCATNPVTGKREISFTSEAQELAIGAKNYGAYQQAQGGDLVTYPRVTAYVQDVGSKLAAVSDRKLPYEFVVLNDSVPNAWALPGGKIAINRGLLIELNSEAELAAVLGHEIVHAAAKHTAKQMDRGILAQTAMAGLQIGLGDSEYANLGMMAGQMGGALMLSKYGRGAELESDEYGIKYMSKAGYDPNAAVDLQKTFVRLSKGKNPGWLGGLFASHPPSQERVQKNQEHATKYPPGKTGVEEYKNAMGPLRAAKDAYDTYDEGLKALVKKDPATALRLARQAISLEPKEPHFYALASKAEAVQKNYAAAEKQIDRALVLNSHYFDYHLMKAQLAEKRGNRSEARTSYEKSLTLLPTPKAHHALGMMALNSGSQAVAMRHFSAAASSNTPEGEASRVMLAKTDLPKNPGKYIETRLALGRDGYLRVQVINRSAVKVSFISIQLNISGQIKNIYVRDTLRPGQTYTTNTRFGPYGSSEEIQGRAATRVIAAKVVE
ncbi:MAG: putative Zn-dependent protease [Candidatus Omnitrophota bacterium]|jgi:predicted Zn-dependent protease